MTIPAERDSTSTGPNRQLRNGKPAALISRDRAALVRGLLRRPDIGASKRGAGCIRDAATQRGPMRLCRN